MTVNLRNFLWDSPMSMWKYMSSRSKMATHMFKESGWVDGCHMELSASHRFVQSHNRVKTTIFWGNFKVAIVEPCPVDGRWNRSYSILQKGADLLMEHQWCGYPNKLWTWRVVRKLDSIPWHDNSEDPDVRSNLLLSIKVGKQIRWRMRSGETVVNNSWWWGSTNDSRMPCLGLGYFGQGSWPWGSLILPCKENQEEEGVLAYQGHSGVFESLSHWAIEEGWALKGNIADTPRTCEVLIILFSLCKVKFVSPWNNPFLSKERSSISILVSSSRWVLLSQEYHLRVKAELWVEAEDSSTCSEVQICWVAGARPSCWRACACFPLGRKGSLQKNCPTWHINNTPCKQDN